MSSTPFHTVTHYVPCYISSAARGSLDGRHHELGLPEYELLKRLARASFAGDAGERAPSRASGRGPESAPVAVRTATEADSGANSGADSGKKIAAVLEKLDEKLITLKGARLELEELVRNRSAKELRAMGKSVCLSHPPAAVLYPPTRTRHWCRLEVSEPWGHLLERGEYNVLDLSRTALGLHIPEIERVSCAERIRGVAEPCCEDAEPSGPTALEHAADVPAQQRGHQDQSSAPEAPICVSRSVLNLFQTGSLVEVNGAFYTVAGTFKNMTCSGDPSPEQPSYIWMDIDKHVAKGVAGGRHEVLGLAHDGALVAPGKGFCYVPRVLAECAENKTVAEARLRWWGYHGLILAPALEG